MGAITGYTYHDVEPWIVSLKKSGYTGDIVLVCFNIGKETIQKIEIQGVKCVAVSFDEYGNAIFPTNNFNVVVDRFSLYHSYLNSDKIYDYVLLTDVKDVIFQKNPAEYDMLNAGILTSSEGIQYKNEPWGANNLKASFGDLYYTLQFSSITNAGVIAGRHEDIKDLCLMITLVCQGKPKFIPGGGGPDQAALNVILNTTAWRELVQPAGRDWACQAGTTADPNKIQEFRKHLLDPEPIFEDGYVKTFSGNIMTIVHQYDRVPLWNKVFNERYRE
jgi:hypothetical protein